MKGRVILVAGGAAGIGEASAVRLGEEGATVVVGDVNFDGARAVAGRIAAAGGAAFALEFDMGSEESIAALINEAVEEAGRLDGMHVNAIDARAVLEDSDLLTASMDTYDEILNLALRGYFMCARLVLPRLIERGGGSIVFTSADHNFNVEPQKIAYRIAKAGVNTLTGHIATMWGREGIRCNAVLPGMIMTPGAARAIPQHEQDEMLAATPATRHGQPEDIAAVVAMLMSDDAGFINGQLLSVDGGLKISVSRGSSPRRTHDP